MKSQSAYHSALKLFFAAIFSFAASNALAASFACVELRKEFSRALANAAEKNRVVDDLQRRERGHASQGVSTESRVVDFRSTERSERAFPYVRADHRRTDRHDSATKRLRQHEEIRRHVVALPGEQMAGAANAGLDFIEYQKRIVSMA